MAANCSASLPFIFRTAATSARRPRLPPKRHTSSYHHAASNEPWSTSDSSMNSILGRPNNFHGSHATHATAGRVRSMAMVTQTYSLEKDDKKTEINTPQPNDGVINATTSKGGIEITASCAARIRQLASTRPNPVSVYLRLYVDAGGCSGFQYKFLLLSEDNDGNSADDDDDAEDGTIDPKEDITFKKDGMRVVVDQTSLELLRGSTIDYVQEMIRSSFAVANNPQSESACGCGSSFAVKNFEANPALD